MPCEGLGAALYDRYLLGLLSEPERLRLESHLNEHCEACLRGLQRSMNLWLVFATTLDGAEPSEDFKSRLVNAARLSKKTLTFPTNSAPEQDSSIRWRPLTAVLAFLLVLIFGAWIAGRQSGRLDSQPADAEISRLTRALAASQVQVREEKEQIDRMKSAAGASRADLIHSEISVERQLSRSRAEADRYRAVLARTQQATSDDERILSMLAMPGARLTPMESSKLARGSVAYSLLIPRSQLFFIGSNLPRLRSDRTFQLWLLRKDEPRIVSAGVFTPDESKKAIVRFENGSVLFNIVQMRVTDEPLSGSSVPTGGEFFALREMDQ